MLIWAWHKHQSLRMSAAGKGHSRDAVMTTTTTVVVVASVAAATPKAAVAAAAVKVAAAVEAASVAVGLALVQCAIEGVCVRLTKRRRRTRRRRSKRGASGEISGQRDETSSTGTRISTGKAKTDTVRHITGTEYQLKRSCVSKRKS